MQPIYLDFNSTAPLLPEAAAAMAEAAAAGYANPASQHAGGRRAHRKLEDTREEIARLLGADLTSQSADQLIFTSGGTEANNLALRGLVTHNQSAVDSPQPRLIISAIEHPSIAATAEFLSRQGWHIDRLRVTPSGIVDLSHLDELLALNSPLGKPRLVSVMLANNETGVIQPLEQIVQRCTTASVPVHTDAVQAVGKLPINFRKLGVAAMTVAPHKFGGPRGIGALLVRHDVRLQPILYGGAQQFEHRPGTESIDLPIGFLAALATWEQNRSSWTHQMESLRNRFEAGIQAIKPRSTIDSESIVINGAKSPRLPHTSNIAFLGHDRQALLMALDLASVYCSTGSACASGSSEPSPTLLAMNLPNDVVASSLRFSLGPTTTEAEIDEAVRRIAAVVGGKRTADH